MMLQEPLNVPNAVYVIWGITLAVAVLVVLPVTVVLLQRTLNAARSIERYLAEMRDAGVGIAENTRHIQALDATIQTATTILSTADSVRGRAATIEQTLAGRVNGGGHEG